MSSHVPPGATSTTAASTGPPRRALILDDDALIVRALARTLRARGFVVETTTDSDAAIASAEREEPDVVVSDLHMPKSCGAQFLTSIASVAPNSVRVLMSADPDFRPKVGSLAEARVHALLNKSDLGSLAGILHALLRGRHEIAETSEAREALAHHLAHVLGRPQQEEDSHRHRTARGAAHVAKILNLPADEVEQARLGAILHDIGQIAVPQHVFARAGGLGAADRVLLEAHPDAGARIVDAMPSLRGALGVIGSHHERQDGRGYPSGLSGRAIPGAARAFQVVDAYDAMTRGRPHAPARSHEDVIAELALHAGEQHDVEAVRALASLGEEALAAVLHG